jgi:hypothetical protein
LTILSRDAAAIAVAIFFEFRSIPHGGADASVDRKVSLAKRGA